MDHGWEPTPALFEAMYRRSQGAQRPELKRFLERIHRSLEGTTTKTVRGDGNCLISSINEAVGQPRLNVRDETQRNEILQHPAAQEYITMGVLEARDLGGNVNNLDINWCIVFARILARPIVVFIHKDDTFLVAEFPANDPNTPPICLLLHNGHFWPIRHNVPAMITRWKNGTFCNFAA